MAQEPTSIPSQRIVIVRPSALGDVCRSVPVLASLRAALPNAHIAWVVQDDFADAIDAHPDLNEVIAFPRNRFGKWWKSPTQAIEVRRWFRDLKRRKFDVAIDCQGLSRSGLITRGTRAPLRIGLRDAREFAWLCYNRRVPEGDQPLPAHSVDRMLALLEPLGVPAIPDMRLYAPESAIEWWRGQRAELSMNEARPYAVIAPGSRWASKRWPIERFAELLEPLARRGFARVIVIGSPGEREQVAPMTNDELRVTNEAASRDAASPATHSSLVTRHSSFLIDLVGRTTIAQTMAVIAEAGLVIANDSAPLHMAVGFDRPCVALYGPTDPLAVGPYARAECVVRAYQPKPGETVDYKDARIGDSLMRLISTTLALQSIDRVLALWPQRSRIAAPPAASRVSGVNGASDGQHLGSPQNPRTLSTKAAT